MVHNRKTDNAQHVIDGSHFTDGMVSGGGGRQLRQGGIAVRRSVLGNVQEEICSGELGQIHPHRARTVERESEPGRHAPLQWLTVLKNSQGGAGAGRFCCWRAAV